MAYIRVKDYIDVGTGGVLEAVCYQIAKDKDFKKIIDQSMYDRVNLEEWHSMLPKLPEDGGTGYYADEDELYGRFKLVVNGFESDWYVVGPESQNIQDVRITEKGQETIYTTSQELGWTR